MKNRNVSIIRDTDNKKIVVIHDILFKGKRQINWDDVEIYLKQYVGEIHEIIETQDLIYLGSDMPDEYAGSVYTRSMRGAVAKAKANAAQGLPELIQIAKNKQHTMNKKAKNSKRAAYGWYHYYSRFALPVYSDEGELERYNVFHADMLIRHDLDGKLYLYDIINIKKEPSNPSWQ